MAHIRLNTHPSQGGQAAPPVIWGAPDPKAGWCGTLGNLVQDPRLNHRLEMTAGVLEEDSAALLRGFFASLRKRF